MSAYPLSSAQCKDIATFDDIFLASFVASRFPFSLCGPSLLVCALLWGKRSSATIPPTPAFKGAQGACHFLTKILCSSFVPSRVLPPHSLRVAGRIQSTRFDLCRLGLCYRNLPEFWDPLLLARHFTGFFCVGFFLFSRFLKQFRFVVYFHKIKKSKLQDL